MEIPNTYIIPHTRVSFSEADNYSLHKPKTISSAIIAMPSLPLSSADGITSHRSLLPNVPNGGRSIHLILFYPRFRYGDDMGLVSGFVFYVRARLGLGHDQYSDCRSQRAQVDRRCMLARSELTAAKGEFGVIGSC